jgi:tetratricopeptide (TPR) repeat protein
MDPDNVDAQKAIKNIKASQNLKEQASEIFKKGDYKGAVEAFDNCLTLDPLNLAYNSIISFNKGLAYSKLNQNENSLKSINISI